MLLEHILKADHAFLVTYPDYVLSVQQRSDFFALVKHRIDGVPVAYLTGKREFYDLSLNITNAVLIPRPETELLVEWALALVPADRPYHILDLGTGSGAIAIAIAKHRPCAHVVAADLSTEAIAVAQSNAKSLNIKNLGFITSNWFDELLEHQFDLIVSNPPYVAESDPHLQQGDLRFEPRIALSAGAQGLSCIAHIIRMAPQYLKADSWLLLEHGYDQASECRRLLADRDFSNICSHPDLAGIMRASGGRWSNASL